MRHRASATLLILVLPSVFAGCFGEEPDPAAPGAEIGFSLAPNRAWFNVTLPQAESVRWQLLRGLDVVASGNASQSGERWTAFTPATLLGNGTWSIRFTQGGLLLAQRSFTLAAPAWAPHGAGTWAFRAESTGNRTLALDGTLRSGPAGWRLDAAGTIRTTGPNGTADGPILHFAAEGRHGGAVVTRTLMALTMTGSGQAPLGNLSVERILLREGRAEDRDGVAHDALLYRTWTRLTGVLRGANASQPVDSTTLTDQWISLRGIPLYYTRWTWDNATQTSSRHAAHGLGDDAPQPVSLARGPMPQPLAEGDAFTLAGPAPLAFVVGAHAGGLRAEAFGPQANATLDLGPGGDLRAYAERAAAGPRVLVAAPR